jgi:SAM-dependent methyltransferase
MESSVSLNPESAVRDRYAAASQVAEAALCCPIDYDPRYLAVLPDEILEKDYGCGDPSRYVRPGDVVLDLGSGGGKICFIASQIVGPEGSVIGIDMTDDMLALAKRHQPVIAERIGWDNVQFHKGKIQDLSMIESSSVDVVVSNCVLNLVDPADKPRMFAEIFRVLKRGGRAAISDIVSDEDIPARLRADEGLWSGCISGALREDELLEAFDVAGFFGMTIETWTDAPWQTVEGIEFRSVTVQAWKGKQGPCWDHNQAVIYKGPFKTVLDDDGHRYPRGLRVAVCQKTFELLRKGPYAASFAFLEPRCPVAEGEAPAFPCLDETLLRPARATKGEDYALTTEVCADTSCC